MLRAGLIGVPSTGKTTLFQLLTRTSTSASSSRFGPTNANIAVASVPDPRLDKLTELFQTKRRVPATVVVADIVGTSGPRDLVDVAPYREADALLHVVRHFGLRRSPTRLAASTLRATRGQWRTSSSWPTLGWQSGESSGSAAI